MYQPGVRNLNGFTDSLTQIIDAAAGAYKDVTRPAYSLPPYQGPNIDPRTGIYVPSASYYPAPATNYTVPLLIGGGLLLLIATSRRRR